ncbi:multiple sugar transport system permease protein/N-acetylglucosamine transport system permease protein [Actinomadura luteofluorescens]|uniref:Multiple sugar transport system permease protein/N-acetylglucosamine transport system permease protein n=1 Tax=Actinomadura luteofluorescens TaxID=46163 RepID=A0A7Y9ERC7_9ACTN|nr:carbohydrate ABC transporter permease [Actinomadura luteofluorescens]NYD51665.1 multiple sugar transport system permease protein/N-acetylglucosamine transport system permease protein [Actinomadura luteofluorescens]
MSVIRRAPRPARHAGAAFAWLFALFSVAVAVWMVLNSLKSTRAVFDDPWGVPTDPRWGNYARAWQASDFGIAALNTVMVVFGTAVATIALAAPAAYALSRLLSRWNTGLTVFFALGLGIPAQVMILPLYVMMNRLYLVDSLVGLWILYVATSMPFTVFFLTGFFGSLPRELEEAAALDGASPNRTFWQIMLPLARSGVVTALILNIIQHWGETLFALIFLQSEHKATLSIALLGFLQRMQYNGADWGGLFAGVCTVVLPLLVCYVWLGRRIIEGMTLGSLK